MRKSTNTIHLMQVVFEDGTNRLEAYETAACRDHAYDEFSRHHLEASKKPVSSIDTFAVPLLTWDGELTVAEKFDAISRAGMDKWSDTTKAIAYWREALGIGNEEANDE